MNQRLIVSALTFFAGFPLYIIFLIIMRLVLPAVVFERSFFPCFIKTKINGVIYFFLEILLGPLNVLLHLSRTVRRSEQWGRISNGASLTVGLPALVLAVVPRSSSFNSSFFRNSMVFYIPEIFTCVYGLSEIAIHYIRSMRKGRKQWKFLVIFAQSFWVFNAEYITRKTREQRYFSENVHSMHLREYIRHEYSWLFSSVFYQRKILRPISPLGPLEIGDIVVVDRQSLTGSISFVTFDDDSPFVARLPSILFLQGVRLRPYLGIPLYLLDAMVLQERKSRLLRFQCFLCRRGN